MKALIVDDDGLMAQTIAVLLRRKGFTVTVVSDGAGAREMLTLYPFDAILLDMRLGRESGLDVLRGLRARQIATPVLILSGDLDTDTKVAALKSGADDYVTKPFRIDELVARILAVVRRARSHATSTLQIGGITLDLSARLASARGTAIPLTVKEYDLLEALALSRGRTLSKDDLLGKLYDGLDEPGARIIDVFLCKLRRKLSDALGDDAPIETVWGRGYRLTEGRSHAQPSMPLSA